MNDELLEYWLYASIDELIDINYNANDAGDGFNETRKSIEISNQSG